MEIPCIACQSRFSLDGRFVKATGSLVRCTICNNMFWVYPPGIDDVQVGKDINVDQPNIDDLSKVKQADLANGLADQTAEEINANRKDGIVPIEDFDEEDDDQDPAVEDPEHADFTDLSEYDDKIDWDDFP